MNTRSIPAAVAGAIFMLGSGAALAADHDAGLPLAPADAAGPWTVESGGHGLCVVILGAEKAGAGAYRASVPATCGDAIPAGVAGWAPTDHGMKLVGQDGQTLIGFGRWSDSLFVSHLSSRDDIQLKRGGPAS